ncbi:MAG: hypothetical protein QXP77_03205 [Candidatus Aenigmatarchaeota archaeon]
MKRNKWFNDANIYGVPGFVRLFTYIKEVSEIIGEEKAWEILEEITTRKRLEWLEKNEKKLRNLKGDIIGQAYKIFYQEYLKLNPKDVEIVEKTMNRLVMRWYNFCPVLEACKILGLDTREVCKRVYDSSVQAFLEKINPKLKFKRNYQKIRPYAKYCEEIIILEE